MITNNVFLCVFIFSYIKEKNYYYNLIIMFFNFYVFVYIPVLVYEHHMCVEACRGQKRH